MKIIKLSDVKGEESSNPIFTGGKVYIEYLIDEKLTDKFRIAMVNFNPGARCVFHSHTTEQVLYITGGKGIVATEHEEHVVTPGTMVFIPAGLVHWHGATKDSPFSHAMQLLPSSETTLYPELERER